MAVFLEPALPDCWGAVRSSEAEAAADSTASEAEEAAELTADSALSEALATAFVRVESAGYC